MTAVELHTILGMIVVAIVALTGLYTILRIKG